MCGQHELDLFIRADSFHFYDVAAERAGKQSLLQLWQALLSNIDAGRLLLGWTGLRLRSPRRGCVYVRVQCRRQCEVRGSSTS